MTQCSIQLQLAALFSTKKVALDVSKSGRATFKRQLKKHAIVVPMFGTKEFDFLLSNLARLTTNRLTDLKRLLIYCADRHYTVDHIKMRSQSTHRFGTNGPLASSNDSKSANLSSLLARRHKCSF